jgi:hypothetical protein
MIAGNLSTSSVVECDAGKVPRIVNRHFSGSANDWPAD